MRDSFAKAKAEGIAGVMIVAQVGTSPPPGQPASSSFMFPQPTLRRISSLEKQFDWLSNQGSADHGSWYHFKCIDLREHPPTANPTSTLVNR
jgi:hypothetical protein